MPPPQANIQLVLAATVTTAAALLYWQSSKPKTEGELDVLGSLGEAAVSVGKAATSYLQKVTNSEPSDGTDTVTGKVVQEYMKKELENQMIEWKKKQPTAKQHQFELFLLENYPENIRSEGSEVVWVDPRVCGENWRGAFLRVSASQQTHQLGPPPT
jgi:hypothetical protein